MTEFLNSISKLDAFIIGMIIGVIWLAFEKISKQLQHKKTDSKTEKEVKKEIEKSELLQYLFASIDKEHPKTLYETILELVDSFINNAVEVYFTLEAKPDDHYITVEETDTLTKYILVSVSKNMTPEVIHIISLVYNINSNEDLTKFLRLRIKLRMIDILVNVNRPVE